MGLKRPTGWALVQAISRRRPNPRDLLTDLPGDGILPSEVEPGGQTKILPSEVELGGRKIFPPSEPAGQMSLTLAAQWWDPRLLGQ